MRTVHLSPRERELLAILSSEGLSNKAIASRLHVAENTVKSFVHQMCLKYDVHNRLQLALAYLNGGDK